MKTSIPDYAMSEEQFHARPDAGTTSRGKTNNETAALGKPKTTGAVVEDAKCDDGATAKKAFKPQLGFNWKDKSGTVVGNGYRGN